jgi:hypothetical protein
MPTARNDAMRIVWKIAWRVALVIAAISIMYLLILFFDRRDVMEVRNVIVDPPMIKAGERYTFSFDARPLRDEGCQGESITKEIDSTGKEFLFNSPIVLDRKPDGWKPYARDIMSHRSLAPGEVRYVRDIKHWCFFLQALWPIREHREVTYTVLPP